MVAGPVRISRARLFSALGSAAKQGSRSPHHGRVEDSKLEGPSPRLTGSIVDVGLLRTAVSAGRLPTTTLSGRH